MSKIAAALAQLDPSNDQHWTSDGLPRLDTVKFFAGDQSLTRDAVTSEAPGFTRSTARGAQGTQQAAQATNESQSPTPTAEQVAQPVGVALNFTASPLEPEQRVLDLEDSNVRAAQPGTEGTDPASEPSGTAGQDPVQAARTRVAEATREAAQAGQALAQAVAALDALITTHVDGKKEPLSKQIGDYHARQLELLQQRADHKQWLKSSGVSLKDLLPSSSPIDDALRRRNASRGTQRPRLPLKT